MFFSGKKIKTIMRATGRGVLIAVAICMMLLQPEAVKGQAFYQHTARVTEPAKPQTPQKDATVIPTVDDYVNEAKVEEMPAEPATPQPTPALIALRQAAAAKAAAAKAFEAHLDSVITLPFDVERVEFPLLPRYFFAPAVYTPFDFPDSLGLGEQYAISDNEALAWLEREEMLARRINDMRYRLFFGSPSSVRYNVSMLPEAPKKYHAVVNPEDHTIEIETITSAPVNEAALLPNDYERRHWIRSFNSMLQFSQAYVSPNWYQGGNNNINGIGQVIYNVKLNPQFHPTLLFDTTVKYKVGINSAPDDSVHSYNITEDVFQLNTTFGVKAAKNWYYSLTVQFKTQLLNSYNTNSYKLRSAFLSPGDLTAGIGMTYNRVNAKKTFSLDLSLAPLSYNLRTCINNSINETSFDIKEGRNAQSKFGSSLETKLMWKLCPTVIVNSRVFAFTDYSLVQFDWENTIEFIINRFMTSQIYTNLRYDNHTPHEKGDKWRNLQFKEILSIGFSYKFSSF